VVQPPCDVGCGAGVGVGAGGSADVLTPAIGAIPGASHPPLAHVPPPSAVNGSGVVHPLLVTTGVGAGAGVGLDVGAGALAGGVIPGGSHPPL